MKVSGWKDTASGEIRNVYGVRLRLGDRDDLFISRRPESVWLTIGDATHRITLLPGFWNKCPEFRDNDDEPIRRLLEQLGRLVWETRDPPQFELTELAEDRFLLVVRAHGSCR